MQWTVHGSRRVYDSPWVQVDLDDVEIPGGARFEHHVLRFPRTSVGAVVVDQLDGAEHVLLLWRHRFITDEWGWEIPAGWVDDGEDPIDAVRREVAEETGFRPDVVRPLTAYSPSSGISAQRFLLFVGSAVRPVGTADPAESSRVEWVPLDRVPRLAAEGQIPDGPSLLALTYYLAVARVSP